jgi:uncharacterized protein with PIN domain
MNRSSHSYQLPEGQESERKPRCRACGGETTQVLVSYGTRGARDEKAKRRLQYEWECMSCGKSFKVGNNPHHRSKKR